MLCLGVVPKVEYLDDADYSKWLGKGYEHVKTASGWPGSIVSNHMGFMDINLLAYVFKGKVGYAAS